jgi:hypothetical protein
METLGDNLVTQKELKKSKKFYCTFCDYTCNKISNWRRHLLTSKHSNMIYSEQMVTIKEPKEPKEPIIKEKQLVCNICHKTYKSRNGLWKHNKICKLYKLEHNDDFTDKELMMMIIKDNSELKNIIMEVIKNGTITNTNSNNNINSNNKSFNLQFFLNETCKNAMNITDFVNSLQLKISDLENVGELGYVEGISNIIIKNLNEMDVTLRPVHCTDKKRETMYVKDENKWEKEDDNKSKLHKMVKKITNKNIDLISEFKEIHPDWKKSTSKVSDQFDKIIIESMGGKGDNNYEKEEKIIKKVAKAVFVDKVL